MMQVSIGASGFGEAEGDFEEVSVQGNIHFALLQMHQVQSRQQRIFIKKVLQK